MILLNTKIGIKKIKNKRKEQKNEAHSRFQISMRPLRIFYSLSVIT